MLRALRVLVALGVLMLLAIIGIELAVKGSEYPGLTRPAVGYVATYVLPLVAVVGINVAALAARAPRWLWGLAIVANAALLARTLPHFSPSAPPIFVALPIVAAMMLLASIGLEVARRARYIERTPTLER